MRSTALPGLVNVPVIGVNPEELRRTELLVLGVAAGVGTLVSDQTLHELAIGEHGPYGLTNQLQ